jgi:hypothetical protein
MAETSVEPGSGHAVVPPVTFPVEGPLGRRLRRWGLLLLLLASMLPYHGCRVHPGQLDGHGSGKDSSDWKPTHTGLNGAAILEGSVRGLLGSRGFQVEDAIFPCDGKSDDLTGLLVFLAMPFWALSLLLVRGDRRRTRWVVGTLLWMAMGAVFLWAGLGILGSFDLSKGPPLYGIEGPPLLLPIAGALLLARPRSRRAIPDVEATVSSQAVLGIGVCLGWPVLTAWNWMYTDDHALGPVLRALWANYRIGFWAALLALVLVAAPLFLSEERLGRLVDRLLPWRARP